MTDARLILDAPASGTWNMAVDEALLASAARTGQLTLRVYSWSEPTLSLGYFQSFEERNAHEPSADCPLVRRATGGGAIIHDRELTYSLTAPIVGRAGPCPSWYDACHSAWITALAGFGIETRLCPSTDRQRDGRFLCFQRRSAGDLLLDGSKICGSAQRRHRRALLQHGSLLLGRSPAAPELAGIADLTDTPAEPGRWLDRWLRKLAGQLGVCWRSGILSADEKGAARSLERAKFGAAEWTLRR